MQLNTFIKKVNNDEFKEKMINYLNRYGLNSVNDELINNLNYIYINDKIMGTISYEKFGKYGLIRAFIYSKEVDLSIIRKLFNNLILNCKDDNIKCLIAFINNDESKVFNYLGFNHINEEDVYIEETNFLNTDFKNLSTYLYNI